MKTIKVTREGQPATDEELQAAVNGQPLPPISEYVTRVTRLTVSPRYESLFSEQATHISIADEAAGEFIEIEQQRDGSAKAQTILVDPEEWPTVKAAIETLLQEIGNHKSTS